MSDYWFFLSYSRTDGDVYLQQFFKDLAMEIRGLAGLKSNLSVEDIGFFDQRDIDVGDTWDAILATALQSSRVMICLYSNGYFKSEWCGIEFQVFRSRVEEYVKRSEQKLAPPPLIIPILWRPPSLFSKFIPKPLTDLNIQYTHADLGEAYAHEGLLQLVRLKDSKYKDAYFEFVQRIATRIFEVADPSRLAPLKGLPPLKEVRSAFVEPSSVPTAPVHTGDPITAENVGPRTAQFVFVAGCSSELQQIRPAARCYGIEGGRDWRPWDPPDDSAIGILAQAAAVDQKVFYEHLPVDATLIDRLRKAEETNTMVVMVVDPWSVQMPSYQDKMLAYDQNNFANCAVLVPWSKEDQAVADHKQTLTAAIQNTFFRSRSNTTYFRDPIVSPEEFQQVVSGTICEIRRRLMQRAQIPRMVKSGYPLPAVSGPGEAS